MVRVTNVSSLTITTLPGTHRRGEVRSVSRGTTWRAAGSIGSSSGAKVGPVIDHRSVTTTLSPHQGGPKFGAVSEVLFWSLPSLGSPFSLVSFTVRSAAHQLELRWRHEHVVCIGTYIVKACSQAQGGVCETNIVNTDN